MSLILLAVIAATPQLGLKAASFHHHNRASQPEDTWYIWCRDEKSVEVSDYVLNTAMNRAGYPLKSEKYPMPDGGTLLVLDLDQWLPETAHRINFEQIMAQYQDKTFYVYSNPGEVRIRQLPFKHGGHTYNQLTFKVPIPEINPALLKVAPGAAIWKNGLQQPIVEAEQFFSQCLREFYYKFKGYDTLVGTERKRLTQDEFLGLYGVDLEISDKLGGTEFVGMNVSGVTNKPRRGVFAYGRATKVSAGLPLAVVTQDISDDDVDVDQHPLLNLLDFQFAATEILVVEPAGTIAYAIFDANGVLQDEVPPNIARDHTIPAPFTDRLRPALSCIICHAPFNQWQPMPNEVQLVLPTVDFLNERERHKLFSLYSGDLGPALERARDDHEKMTIRMVNFSLPGSGYAKRVGETLKEVTYRYFYSNVDAKEAMRTLGSDKEFKEVFQTVGLIHPTILYLLEGRSVTRTDWERVYPSALAELLGKK